MNDHSSYEKNRAERAASDLAAFVNQFGHDDQAFAEAIAREHKTLQQSLMRLMMRTIEAMSEVVPDDRNAATVELAKDITKIAKGRYLPFI